LNWYLALEETNWICCVFSSEKVVHADLDEVPHSGQMLVVREVAKLLAEAVPKLD